MPNVVSPSPELVEQLKKISSLEIDRTAVHEVDVIPNQGKGERSTKMCRVIWPEDQDDIIEKATRRAVEEAVSRHSA